MRNIRKMIRGIPACRCGRAHNTTIKDIRCGRGLVREAGNILKENGFSERLLLVTNTGCLEASKGILESLSGFSVQILIYDELRVATMEAVERVEKLITGNDLDVISVGSGSLNDICRLACARQDKMLCLFATAPSMDGFASDSAPIVKDGFKSSFPARSPQVIIADTEILAKAPARLKSAGFGDMVAKYVGLVDWQISSLVSGEYYCPEVAAITREGADAIMAMADRVTKDDPEAAGQIFESLIMTGLGMSFTKNSRPASGAEHIIAHMIDCMDLQEGKIPNLHGEDVGVATLEVMKYYRRLAEAETISIHEDRTDWKKVYDIYGPLAEDVRRLNTPDTILDGVDRKRLVEAWPKIRKIIRSVPSYEECLEAMKKAGCMTTVEESGKTPEFYKMCMDYSPYMRRRLTLLRLTEIFDPVW